MRSPHIHPCAALRCRFAVPADSVWLQAAMQAVSTQLPLISAQQLAAALAALGAAATAAGQLPPTSPLPGVRLLAPAAGPQGTAGAAAAAAPRGGGRRAGAEQDAGAVVLAAAAGADVLVVPARRTRGEGRRPLPRRANLEPSRWQLAELGAGDVWEAGEWVQAVAARAVELMGGWPAGWGGGGQGQWWRGDVGLHQ
jgi:hypothetical protein